MQGLRTMNKLQGDGEVEPSGGGIEIEDMMGRYGRGGVQYDEEGGEATFSTDSSPHIGDSDNVSGTPVVRELGGVAGLEEGSTAGLGRGGEDEAPIVASGHHAAGVGVVASGDAIEADIILPTADTDAGN
eukprot:g11718.t1